MGLYADKSIKRFFLYFLLNENLKYSVSLCDLRVVWHLFAPRNEYERGVVASRRSVVGQHVRSR
jgi:hypothetical protein